MPAGRAGSGVRARTLGLFAGETFSIADDFDRLPDEIAEAYGVPLLPA
ncbi:MAG: hypothetical protein ABMB14_15970 [Myxococcota bacterium]